ncbi:fumarate reductase flavoprotein subunit [Lachnospiraceae bacterium KM106-2]|nr:fumarate reductase flavoprotein subunit [Lachnospiraceae bacterium KM106-2]
MKKNLKKAVVYLTCTVCAISMIGCSNKSTGKASTSFKEGTYTGSGTGKNGAVKVEVEFAKDSIKNVKVTEQKETEGIADPAIEKIPTKIVDSQSLAVDVVSGATITSNAIIDAVTDCVKQAGGDVDALKSASSASADTNKVEEAEADVVVVGAGAAGSSAALSALQSGKKVILLEKTAQPMGAGTLAGGMFAADSKLQKEAGEEVSKEWLYEEYKKASEGYMNSLLVRNIINESGKTVDWLMENGMKLNLVDSGSGGAYAHQGMPSTLHGYAEGGTVAITNLVETFKKAGGDVRWSTPASELITKDGKVTGVKAKKEDGTTLSINAKAVVIATGGYGGNEEMLKEYQGENYTMGEVQQNTGDGLNMAWSAGADKLGTETMHYFWETFTGDQIGKLSEKLGDDWFSLTNWTMFPNLRVNSQGKRFGDETNVTLYSVHGAEIAMQPGQVEYVIVDSATLDKVAKKGTYVLEDQFKKWVGDEQFYMEFNEPNSTDDYYKEQHTPRDYAKIFDSVLDSGVVFKGDSIEDLAKQMNVDASELKKSVKQYNNAIKTGKDEQFFADTKRLIEVKEGPYYAIKFCARNLSTLGGIRINENMQVVDKDANVIEGLYAAGADAGGMYGKAYVDFEGGTLGFAYTSGRLAGINASKNIK